jgi:hypothetical protein
MRTYLLAIAVIGAAASAVPAIAQAEAGAPRAAFVTELDRYEPGTTVEPGLLETMDAAATRLEAEAGPFDLAGSGLVDGLWLTRLSTQGIVGEIDVAFMTRSMPGGGADGGTALIDQVLQELRLDDGFYRNTMLMRAGPDRVPVLYTATADLAVDRASPDELRVRFREFVFAPARQDVTAADVRAALALPDAAPLAIVIPETALPPWSTSRVTYLDEELRINRGKDYIAIMERIR